MKKTILLGAILIAGVASAFPFRTSCGKIIQVNNAYAETFNQSDLAEILGIMNGEACPQHSGATIIVHIYGH